MNTTRRFLPHLLGITAALCVPAAVVAAVAVPHAFVAGTTISAAAVNANFNAIRDYINTKFRWTGSVASLHVTKDLTDLTLAGPTSLGGPWTTLTRMTTAPITAPETTNCLVTVNVDESDGEFPPGDFKVYAVKEEGAVVTRSAFPHTVGRQSTSAWLDVTSNKDVHGAFTLTAGRAASFGCEMQWGVAGVTYTFRGARVGCTISYICQ